MNQDQGASADADRAGGPTDLSREAASQPKALVPSADSMARSWLVSMTKQGEDRIWRGAERTLAAFDGMQAQLTYLREHHHIVEHMLGIVSVNASPELMGKLRSYTEQLGTLWINRLLDLGVPADQIGQRGVFHADDHLVAQAVEARAASAMSAGTAETPQAAQGEARQRDGNEDCRDAQKDLGNSTGYGNGSVRR